MLFILLAGICVALLFALMFMIRNRIDKPLVFVCQEEYKNWAWGYQHNGMYVDSNGDLYQFKETKDKKHQYDKPAETSTLEEMDLNRGEKTFVRKLAPEELNELKQLFQDAREENLGLGKQNSYGNDGGFTTFNCYEPNNGKLKVYKLLQSGDQGFDSAGSKGEKLGNWLQSKFGKQ